jgi:hypothetical protein
MDENGQTGRQNIVPMSDFGNWEIYGFQFQPNKISSTIARRNGRKCQLSGKKMLIYSENCFVAQP